MKRGSSASSSSGAESGEEKEVGERLQPVRKAVRRQEDPLLSALDRVSGIPLELNRGDPIIHIPGVEARRGQPVPQDDGLLRDARTGKVTQGDDEIGYNPTWSADWFARIKDMMDAEDFEFLQLLAGALKKTPEQLLDLDTLLLQQRTSRDLADARKVELEQLKRGVNERIDDLRKAQAFLDELRATRVSEETGLVQPAQRLLQQDGLGALLRIDRGGLLYPYYLRWQYEFIAKRIGDAGPSTPPVVDALSHDDISRMVFIADTDFALGLMPAGAHNLITAEVVIADDGFYKTLHGSEALRDQFRQYVTTRDFNRILNGGATIHGGPPLVLFEYLDDIVRQATRLGYGHLPGLSPLALSLSGLNAEAESGVSIPQDDVQSPIQENLRFPWFFAHAPAFSTPFYWRQAEVRSGPRNPARLPAERDPPAPASLTNYPSVTNTRALRAARFLYGSGVTTTTLRSVTSASRSVVTGTSPAKQIDLNPGGSRVARLFAGSSPASITKSVMAYLIDGVPPPGFATEPAVQYALRRFVPTRRDYSLICDAVDILLGPLLIRGFESLFASSPIFAVPATPLPNEIGQRVVALKTVLGQAGGVAAAFDPLRFFYTTEARPVMGSLQLGDMLAYVRFNTPAIVTPNAATLWGAGRVKAVDDAVKVANASPITVDADARDARYSDQLWSGLATALGAGLAPDKWRVITAIVGGVGQPPNEATKRQFESSDPQVVRDVVFPILFEGWFSALVAQLGRDHPLTLGASYWPLQTRAIPIPAVEARDKLDQKLLGRLGSASPEMYDKAQGTSWSKADFGAPTPDKLRFLQQMCPIAVLPLMADVLVALYGQDSALLAEIQAADKIVRNLQRTVEEVSDARVQLQKLQVRPHPLLSALFGSHRAPEQDESKNIHLAARRLWTPSARHMLRPEISGQIPLNQFAQHLLDTSIEMCIDWAERAGLPRAPTMPELTGRTSTKLRRAFIDLCAWVEQRQGLDHPGQYKKDKEYEIEPAVAIQRRRQMLNALVAFLGPPRAGVRLPAGAGAHVSLAPPPATFVIL